MEGIKLKMTTHVNNRNSFPVKRLTTFIILDETPFYHSEYLQRLIKECEHIQIIGGARVILPGGGVLQAYLKKKWYLLKFREIFL